MVFVFLFLKESFSRLLKKAKIELQFFCNLVDNINFNKVTDDTNNNIIQLLILKFNVVLKKVQFRTRMWFGYFQRATNVCVAKAYSVISVL